MFNFGKKFSIHFPWSSGLGTLGLKLGSNYGDVCIARGAVRLFTSIEQNNVFGNFCSTRRSWYQLKRTGWRLHWRLNKRDDFWGTWQNGKRRPPLYELPQGGVPQRAWELRNHFAPYKIIEWYGRRLECISFPSPERLAVTVMLREPNDPTTMFEETLEQYLPDTGPIQRAERKKISFGERYGSGGTV